MMKLLQLLLAISWVIPLPGQRPQLIVPIGHTWDLNQAVYDPGGKYLLTAGHDGAAILWETQTGRKIYSFTEPAREVLTVSFSPDGKLIATANEKNEVIIWNARTGAKMKVLQHHTAPVYALAFSPDNTLLATGGNDRQVLLWDTADWRIAATYREHKGSIQALDFSPKGDYLVSAALDHTATLRDLKSKEVTVLAGHTGPLSAIAFSPNGRQILTGSEDGTAKLWKASSGALIRTLRGHRKGITAVDFSPDGKIALTGGSDSRILFWSTQSEALPIDSIHLHHPIQSIDYAANGRTVLLAGKDESTPILMTWEVASRQLTTNAVGEYTVVFAAQFSPDSRRIVTRNAIHGKTMNFTWELASSRISGATTAPVWDAKAVFSPDSNYVVFNNWLMTEDEYLSALSRPQEVSFEWPEPDIPEAINSVAFYYDRTGPVITFARDKLLIGSGNTALVKNIPQLDRTDTLSDHTELVLSVALSPDGRELLSGGWDDRALLWDLETEDTIRSLTSHADGVSSVGFSPDDKYMITGSYDNTVKLWNRQDGAELATLITLDSVNWIVTTPSGLFDATPGAMSRMHYVVNYEAEWEIIELNQLKARYYEPGLLPKLMGYSSERLRPVEAFDDIALYPKVSLSPIKNDILPIQMSERNGGIGKVSIFINGKEVVEEANPLPRRENAKRPDQVAFDLKAYRNYLFKHPDSTNTIIVRAFNEAGWLKGPPMQVEYRLPAALVTDNSARPSLPMNDLIPKLYVVAIGTADYAGTQLDLQYADQDATMMARALQSVGTALFTNGDSLEVHCLTTASPDSTGLEGTPIEWWSADKTHIESVFQTIRRKAKAEDVAVVYLSGHGVTQGGADQTLFYYLTKDVASEDALSDPATRQAYAISSEELTDWLKAIPALKQVLIIDACNSGQIVENLTGGAKALNSSQIRALDRMKDRTGMFVLSGSAADKVSYEAGEYGQGLLTYALLEGMRSATRPVTDGKGMVKMIDVMTLFQYARDRVPELAASINGIQTPMLGFPSRAASFDIGILSDQASNAIQISKGKPIMIRSTFLNETTYRDDLKLADRLEAVFREEASKGAGADLVYVDVYDYPGAYSLGGFYRETAAGIELKLKLLHGDDLPVSLDIPVTADTKRLVRSIVREVKNVILADRPAAKN